MMPENYIQNPPGDSALPGALGLGQSRATIIFNAFYLFSFLVPVPFALVSDAWLGRYTVLCISLRYVDMSKHR
jgi:proton-dependent oligopeptide transporter, POT family